MEENPTEFGDGEAGRTTAGWGDLYGEGYGMGQASGNCLRITEKYGIEIEKETNYCLGTFFGSEPQEE